MSRKISEFFKPKLEPESNPSEAAVKQEEEGDFVIKLDEIEKEIKTEENSPKIRECRVVLKDIKKEEVQKKFKTEEKSANSKTKIVKTRKANKNNVFKCNFCGKNISCKNNLMTHVKKIHSNEMKNLLKCQICGTSFFLRHRFEQHMKKKHLIDIKTKENFVCDFDAKIFPTKVALFHHMKRHEMTIKCEICQAEVKPYSMTVHKKIVHPTGQKFECKICSKSFKARNKWRDHEKIHNKKFNCEICNRKFTIIYKLTKHKKEYHENPGSFECENCGKKFNFKCNLKRHEKTHDKNRPKPFKCQRCDFATDYPRSYKKHQNFHEKQDKRNKQFLWQHMNSVHPVKLFQCDLCGIYIKTMGGVKSHMDIRHKVSKIDS